MVRLYADRPPEEAFAAHVAWGKSFQTWFKSSTWAQRPGGGLGRRIRVGYVSTDFNFHSVAFFCGALLKHDPLRYEVYAYYAGKEWDCYTDWLYCGVERWRDVATLSGAELADTIR